MIFLRILLSDIRILVSMYQEFLVCTMLCDVKREPRYATGQAIKFLENSKQVTTVPQGFKRQAGTAKRYTDNCIIYPQYIAGLCSFRASHSQAINQRNINMWKVILLAIYLATSIFWLFMSLLRSAICKFWATVRAPSQATLDQKPLYYIRPKVTVHKWSLEMG